MLSGLRIQNFALVDRLELAFGKGLNVLTGETGAGKSIVLDAIDIVLGSKVNSRFIRQGAQQATLEATFAIDPTTERWLAQQEIDLLEDACVVCTRELTLTGETMRSRSRVNGVLVNRQILNQLRDRLVEITAQGQTVQLMDATRQRELLDLSGGETLLNCRQVVASNYDAYKSTENALEKRRQLEKERLQRLDVLEYQLKELNEAQLTDAEELNQLEQDRDRLSHVVELQQLSYQAYQLLYQNDNEAPAVTDLLGQAESVLTDMAEYDNKIESVLEMVRSALAQVVEAGQQVNAYGDALETDPEHLNEIEDRIRLLKSISRKYGPTLTEAINFYRKLQAELAELTDGEQSIEQLEKDYQMAQATLEKTCQDLTELRKKAAEKLEKQLVKELKPLAMDKVIFVCQISAFSPSASGADQVVFYFSPNPGEKIQPLSSTASGGEMSRFLLALKACFAQLEKQSGTLIFDEIDAGISGKVAQAIAEKLHQLSQQYQVLCVTHQPLVAAMADSHFRVSKQIIEEFPVLEDKSNGEVKLPKIRTVVRVMSLDNLQLRIEELAQLTGGDSAEDALEFAESLLVKAEAYRLGKVSKL